MWTQHDTLCCNVEKWQYMPCRARQVFPPRMSQMTWGRFLPANKVLLVGIAKAKKKQLKLKENDLLFPPPFFCYLFVSCRAQVATQLKDLVQQQHQQLLHSRLGGPLSGQHLMLGSSGAQARPGDEMTELKTLIHSLRCQSPLLSPHDCVNPAIWLAVC